MNSSHDRKRPIFTLDSFPLRHMYERQAEAWLLELCACEGGATAGYRRAGFKVVAVDEDEAALKRNPAEITEWIGSQLLEVVEGRVAA